MKRAIAAVPIRPKAPQVNPAVMSSASNRANASRLSKTEGYFYGNMGDSIERRSNHIDIGGGHLGDGIMGAGGTYPAQGYGNFYGTGLGYGPANRYGPWSPEATNSGPFRSMRRLSSSSAVHHSIIAACQMAYFGHGVVRNAVDLYTDFASEGLSIIHEDNSVQNFFSAWSKIVHLDERIQTIFMAYFTTGNVFVNRRWAKISNADKTRLKRNYAKVVGSDLYVSSKSGDKIVRTSMEDYAEVIARNTLITDKADAAPAAKSPLDEDNVTIEQNRIPWEYSTLNPLQMEPRGERFKGDRSWVLALDKSDLQSIGKQFNSTVNLNSSDSLPEALKGKLSKYTGRGGGFSAEVKFTDDDLYIIQDRKYDWWDWSIPFVFPSLRALNFKDCLRNMEIRACESVINSIFLFKLGDIQKGLPAEDEHFERLADMLQQPGQALNIIWNEAIEAEVITADVAKLFDPKKHESADRDILVALGIPEALIGGSGGKFANSFVGAATLLERIETARMRVTEWLMNELKIITEAMGFRKMPEVKWGKSSLRDKNAERQLIIQLYDRGILSMDNILEEFETSTDVEAARKSREQPLVNDGVFKPRGPYIKPMDEANLDKNMPQPQTDPLKVKMSPPGTPSAPGKKPNGRPGGTKEPGGRGPQKKPREPQGRSLADVLEEYQSIHYRGETILKALEENLNAKALNLDRYKAKGLRNPKQLPVEERNRLENLAFSIFSHMPSNVDTNVPDEFIVNLLKSGASEGVKADVLATYQSKVSKYVSEFGKDPSKEHRRQFIVSAWTQLAMQTSG